jgi:hypothetical protein
MPKRTAEQHVESLRKAGTTKTITPPNDQGESAVSLTAPTDAAGAESHVAPARSDGPDGSATSPVIVAADENSAGPEPAPDAQPTPVEPGAAAPTSPHNENSEVGATIAEANAESQAPAVPTNPPENNPQPTPPEPEEQPTESDDGGCFKPFVPEVPVPPAPKLVQQPKPHFIDEVLRKMGIEPNPTPALIATELPASTPAEAESAQPEETLAAPVEAPIEPPRMATAIEIFTWIEKALLAQTCLTTEGADLVAFWVISTWCQDTLDIFPCLVITGPAHDAIVVLHVLYALCWMGVLVPGFRRSDLRRLCGGFRTILFSEPNLDKRSAAFLSSQTDMKFSFVDRGSLNQFSRSTAIYAGENPGTHTIQNSIHIHIGPNHRAPLAAPPWLKKMMGRIPVHLDQYRQRYYDHMYRLTWLPSRISGAYAVSRENNSIAAALGHGIVDADKLRRKLLFLLKTQDKQRLFEKSNTLEAVVIEVLLTLSRDRREHASSGEIAGEANRLLQARAETAGLKPEKVGRMLKNLDLPTRRLSKSANGLAFDKAAVAKIHELAAVFMVEDELIETENLHHTQATETK